MGRLKLVIDMTDRKDLELMDYMEPECVLCDKPVGFKQKKQMIPQQRISQKLDELMGRKEYQQAENLLKYWLEEARVSFDDQGVFMLYNEMMGYYRKMADKDNAYKAVDNALSMLDELDYRDSVSGATCYTNAATVYTAFGEPEKSVELFEKARTIYENNREHNEYKLASLYNNMATALVALKRYSEADELYHKALEVDSQIENSQLEMAMTYLNILDALISEKGVENIDDEAAILLAQAKDCLDDERLERDSYYSFVCDKCVGIYRYFGWFRYAGELEERITEIDERA